MRSNLKNKSPLDAESRVFQSFDHGGVGVFELGVFADENDVDLVKQAFLAGSIPSEHKPEF
jgi:hypothetical protein